MTPMNDEQLEKIRNDRRQQIISAALRTFAENGIRLTKIGMIAAEAGVSHGLVYHYFESKEEVLHESLAWAMEGADELFREVRALPLTPLEKVKTFVKFALTEGNSDVFRVIQHVTRFGGAPEKTMKMIRQGSEVYAKELFPLIAAGQADGSVVEGDPQELLELLLTVLSGVLMEGDREWWSRNLDRKVDLLLRMLAAR
ncbi:TetR/AcrR family transcriptional regulator [Paenibacillus sp.]|uniref:TetR/AcrR family transcriptional regulator n=1 Tax=Paenibacillus sp. TaxID=58172 RepID=UPI002811799A|nr:TetR/AcrR family transcriptional regulator [Paenibacillus sp.]